MKKEPERETKAPGGATETKTRPALVLGVDYYMEGGLLVFTARFLLARGYCCGSGCRHCPYDEGVQA